MKYLFFVIRARRTAAKQLLNNKANETSVAYTIAGKFNGRSINHMSKVKEKANAGKTPPTFLPVNRKILLDTLIKHETLTEDDIAKEKNLGLVPDKAQLGYLLSELALSGHILVLSGAVPVTYTITQKGIDEGMRLGQSVD